MKGYSNAKLLLRVEPSETAHLLEGCVDDRTLLVVACLNREVPYFPVARGKGIAVFSFNDATGALTKLSEETGVDNPNYLAVQKGNRCVYAVSDVLGLNEGLVTAHRLDPTTGRLSYVNEQGTLGSVPAYASFDHTGKFLLIANYSMDTALSDRSPNQAIAVMPIRGDGGVDAPVASRAHPGKGPNAQRQERSHAHCIMATPDNRHVVVADLGIDKLMVYRFDGNTGGLTPGEVPYINLPPGSGPRHFIFHPSTRFAYVINELESTIAALSFDQSRGSFQLLHVVPALPTGHREVSHCADLQINPDGRFLYGSNRGHDSIVIHTVDQSTGRLMLVGHQPTLGETPRNFAIDPLGRYLVVANQNGDSLIVFRIDDRTGRLVDTGNRAEIGTPMCVKFACF
jgi:6-phosphogluconolactonase